MEQDEGGEIWILTCWIASHTGQWAEWFLVCNVSCAIVFHACRSWMSLPHRTPQISSTSFSQFWRTTALLAQLKLKGSVMLWQSLSVSGGMQLSRIVRSRNVSQTLVGCCIRSTKIQTDTEGTLHCWRYCASVRLISLILITEA